MQAEGKEKNVLLHNSRYNAWPAEALISKSFPKLWFCNNLRAEVSVERPHAISADRCVKYIFLE